MTDGLPQSVWNIPAVSELQSLPPPEVVHVSDSKPQLSVESERERATDSQLGVEKHASHPPVVLEEPQVRRLVQTHAVSGLQRALGAGDEDRIQAVRYRLWVPRNSQRVRPPRDDERKPRLGSERCGIANAE